MPKLRIVTVCLLLLIVLSQVTVPIVKSVVSSCSASISPGAVYKGTNPNVSFTISNTHATNSMRWVKITNPSSFFTINGTGAPVGWSQSYVPATSATFSGGTIAAGSNTLFTVAIQVSNSATAGSVTWTVEVSDSTDGSGPTSCTGGLSQTISTDQPDETSPQLVSLTISDISDTSAKITIVNDENTTITLNYGTTTNYGITATDTTLSTTHAITLTGLSANTTYHYNVFYRDAAGNQEESGDNTFVTAKAGTTVTTTTTVTVIASPAPTTVSSAPKVVPDTTAPSISLTTDFTESYIEAPTISGRVTDDKGIEYIEYSVDNGKNWLPAEIEGSYGAPSVGFSFLPLGLTDGNYKIVVRARDISKNTGVSRFYTLVIDRLPPQVGGGLISIGPQVLTPNILGIVTTIQGLDQKITLSAVGGPTEIDLSTGNKQLFSLVKNPDNGLWSGTVSFQNPGRYSLTARSIDGADNVTERTIGETIVVSRGRVTDGGKPVTTARLTVYWYDEMIKRYRVWDGAPFAQVNPQAVETDGSYGFLLPAGKYYIEVKAPGYKTVKSTIFELTESLPINTEFTLAKKPLWLWGPFDVSIFDILTTKIETRVVYPEGIQAADEKSLVGEELPSFTLEVDGEPLSSFDLRGKEGVLTFLSSWSPQTSEQINHLANFKDEEKYTLLAIFEQDKSSVVETYQKRGNYDLSIIPDSDGVLVEPLKLHAFPTHVFINRKGIIKDIKVGVLSAEEIREGLRN